MLHTTATVETETNTISNHSNPNPNPNLRLRFRIRFPKVMLLIDVFAVFIFVVVVVVVFVCFLFLFSVCVFPIESNFCTWLLNRNQTATVDITTILRLQVDGARSKVYKPYTATRSPVAADSNGPC